MSKLSLLVVDDESQMRTALYETLKRCGYHVSTAPSGRVALEKLQDRTYHLLITDLKMPRMDGLELLGHVLQKFPDLPVIMITAFATIQTAVQAIKEGAFDYIEKPFSPEVLESAVKRALTYTSEKRKISAQRSSRLTTETAAELERPIITQDPEMLKILELAQDIAQSHSSILILGESGTGKELIARLIHAQSPRCEFPFIAVNCASVPQGLLESELFGHEKGSFTGAVSRRIGKFELAHKGTLLLDEISEMDKALQAKLLRALQEHEVDRVGGEKPIPVDVRIISTTNRDLRGKVEKGDFREDLFYRLNVIPINLPSLKNRKGDIEPLTEFFLRKHLKALGKDEKAKILSLEAIEYLKKHDWPGNVRELENIIERAVVICQEKTIQPKHLFLHGSVIQSSRNEPVGVQTIQDMEKELILKTLKEEGWNRTHAAQKLNISIRTLRNKINEYRKNGIEIPDK